MQDEDKRTDSKAALEVIVKTCNGLASLTRQIVGKAADTFTF